jgi:predicted DNA-binding protein
MKLIWLRILPYIAALVLVGAALFGAYHHGVTVTDAKWKGEWEARDTHDSEAKALNEATERTKEQVYQQSINKAVQDGQRLIDQATAADAAERASRGGVQLAAADIARRLAASEASSHSCTAAASKAAARAGAMLADVLKRADQRAGDLAKVADQARARGMTCEQAYDGLTN